MSQSNVKGKDAKAKDAKKPAGKGAVGEADKNSPKPIEVEYAEDVPCEPDFLLIEKSYNQGKKQPPAQPKRSIKTPMTANAGTLS